MKARGWIILVVVGVIGVGVGTSRAGAGNSAAQNAAATRAYLAAKARFREAISRGDSRRAAAAQALLTQVQSECSNVLAGAGEGGEFRSDTVEVLAYARQLAMRTAYVRLARETAQLRWSSRALTQDVDRQAKTVMAELNLAQPDLCAEARAYVASDYEMVPSGTRRFIAERRALEDELPRPPKLDGLLLPYERAAGLTPPPTIVLETAQERADERAFLNELERLLADLGLPKT
jgi:hypothetical protein